MNIPWIPPAAAAVFDTHRSRRSARCYQRPTRNHPASGLLAGQRRSQPGRQRGHDGLTGLAIQGETGGHEDHSGVIRLQ